MAGIIPPPNGETFYGRYGNIFSYVVLLLMAGLVGYSLYLAGKWGQMAIVGKNSKGKLQEIPDW